MADRYYKTNNYNTISPERNNNDPSNLSHDD